MKTILFQGDSITDCGRIRNEKQNPVERIINKASKKTVFGNGYPSLVVEELKNEGGYTFINRGVSGDRIPDVYARIVRDIISIRPDCMSLLIGVNDVWHGFDFGNGTGKERFEKVYNIFIEELKEELPEMKIMILEPFVLEGPATENRKGQPDRYKNFRNGVEELADITRKLSEKHSLTFVPLQNLLDEEAKKVGATALLSDGVHPTREGHELIKNEWIKAFRALMI